MSPGDRSSIPLEAEPFLFLHPTGAGRAVPGAVQPAGGPFGLEEEPALWPGDTGAAVRTVRPVRPPRPRSTPDSAGPSGGGVLPVTGLRGLPVLAALLLALSELLRRRGQPPDGIAS